MTLSLWTEMSLTMYFHILTANFFVTGMFHFFNYADVTRPETTIYAGNNIRGLTNLFLVVIDFFKRKWS